MLLRVVGAGLLFCIAAWVLHLRSSSFLDFLVCRLLGQLDACLESSAALRRP